MSNRVELNDHEVENVTGGVLIWGEGKTVSPKNDPSVVYHYTSFTKCMQWIDANWNTVQDESCLIAMEAAGLVSKG